MNLDGSSTAPVNARRRCWAWVVALLCLYPGAAWGSAPWWRASAGEIDEALREVELQRRRAGASGGAGTLEALRESNALVLRRGKACPIELEVINGSGHAMWHVRVVVAGTSRGKTTARQIYIPLLPAGSRTSALFSCELWRAPGAPLIVSVPHAIPGSALGPDIIRDMLSEKADHLFEDNTYRVNTQPSSESAAASAMKTLVEAQDQELLRAFAAQLLAEPAGAEILASVLVSPAPALLDGDKIVAAAREGKVDLFAAVELDRMLRGDCSGSAKSLALCAGAIQKRLGPGAGEMLTPRLLASLTAELKQRLLRNDPLEADLVVGVTRELRALGLDTGPIVMRLCNEISPYPDRGQLIFDLAERIEPDAPCVEERRSARRRERWALVATTLGTLGGVVLPVPLIVLYLRRSWRRLRSRLGLDTEERPEERSAPGGVLGPRLGQDRWARAFEGGIADLRRGLEADESDACHAASEAIGRAMESHGAAIGEATRGCAIDALKQGTARSFLARLEGQLLYVLVAPSAHAEPRALVRYAPLADGWVGHAGRLAEGLPALAGAKLSFLALILFVHPEASEVTLVAGYDDGQRRVWPGPLLGAGEALRAEGRVYPHHHEFNLEAA